MPFPSDPIELVMAKDRRRLPLIVEVSQDCRPVAAALLGDIDYVTGRKLSWLYRDRSAEIIDETPIRDLFGTGDEIRIRVGVRFDFDRYVSEQGDGFRIIEVDVIPGSIERFAKTMRLFPIWTTHDPGRKADHDRVLPQGDPRASLEGFRSLIAEPRMTYPRAADLVDFWNPPADCASTYRTENEGLASLLKEHLDLKGPSSIYRDCALHLCGYAGTLCADDEALTGLVEMARDLCRRFWPTRERHALAGRRDRARQAMREARDYHSKRSGPEPWMNERQFEHASAREACRFVFEDALLPVTFEINMDHLNCMIPLHGEHLEMTLLSSAFLGDDDSDSARSRNPLQHLPNA